MEQEDRERLIRVEVSLNQISEIVPLVRDHENTLSTMKKILGWIGSAVIALIGAMGVSLFKGKQ